MCVDDIDVLGQEHEESAHRYCSFNEFLVVLICIASLLTEGGTWVCSNPVRMRELSPRWWSSRDCRVKALDMVMEGRVDQHELLVQEVKYNAEWAKKSSCPGLFRCQDNFIMVEWDKVTDLVMGGIKIIKLVKANMRMLCVLVGSYRRLRGRFISLEEITDNEWLENDSRSKTIKPEEEDHTSDFLCSTSVKDATMDTLEVWRTLDKLLTARSLNTAIITTT